MREVKYSDRVLVCGIDLDFKDSRPVYNVKYTSMPNPFASVECKCRPKVELEDSRIRDVEIEEYDCKIVINPSFIEKVRAVWGDEGVRLVIAHEDLEAECAERGGSDCHEYALAHECERARIPEERCKEIRRWLEGLISGRS